MSRTTILIDQQLLKTAMRIHGFKTRREAVDFALRRLVGAPMSQQEEAAGSSVGAGHPRSRRR